MRSDARGVVRFEAPEWSVYRLSREGYESEEWDPSDHVLWKFGPIFLSCVEDDAGDDG